MEQKKVLSLLKHWISFFIEEDPNYNSFLIRDLKEIKEYIEGLE